MRFTWLDFLIGIFCFIFLLGYVPALSRMRDYSWYERCTSHLHQIGEGLANYAKDNGGKFPRTRFDPQNSTLNQFTNPLASNPFGQDGPLVNDVTAAPYLLIREGYVQPQFFRCPLTQPPTATPPSDEAARLQSNFSSPEFLGYSFANPYPNSAAMEAGYRWDNILPGDFAVAADLNPGEGALSVRWNSKATEMDQGNTRNHDTRFGESVLYADGHVDYVENPFAGVGHDNIYSFGPVDRTTGGVGIVGSPTSKDDSVLLPVAGDLPKAAENPWARDRRIDGYKKIGWTGFCSLLVLTVIFRLTRLIPRKAGG